MMQINHAGHVGRTIFIGTCNMLVWMMGQAACAASDLGPVNDVYLSFSGGSGAPLVMTLNSPIIYTVTEPPGAYGPWFVFQKVSDGSSRASNLTGNITYNINGGAPKTMSRIISGVNLDGVAAQDIFILDIHASSDSPPNIGDKVVLNAGSLTTVSTIPFVAPPSGLYGTFIISYDGDFFYQGTGTQNYFTSFAGTPNQLSVAKNLDGFFNSGKLPALFNYLNSLPASALPAAFDLLSPKDLAVLGQLGFSNTQSLYNFLSNRYSEIMNGEQFSINGLTLYNNSPQFQQCLVASSGGAVSGMKMYAPAVSNDQNIGFFVSGQGVFGSLSGGSSADQYDFSTGGLIMGSDYRIGNNSALGVYAGYQGGEANGVTSKIKTDSTKFGVYGTCWDNHGSWLSAEIGGGLNHYDSDRISLGGTAIGSTDGTEINSNLTVGHNFKSGRLTYGPEVGVSYTRLWINGITESGSMAPLDIMAQDVDSLRGTFAVKTSCDFMIQEVAIRPYMSLGWQHEFMDTRQSVTASFAGGPGTLFTVQGGKSSPDSIVAGSGVQVLLSKTISVSLDYTAEASNDVEIHGVNGSFNVTF